MAVGDVTLTDHGVYAVSGAALKTAVDNINLTTHISGAQLYIIPMQGDQVAVLSTLVE